MPNASAAVYAEVLAERTGVVLEPADELPDEHDAALGDDSSVLGVAR